MFIFQRARATTHSFTHRSAHLITAIYIIPIFFFWIFCVFPSCQSEWWLLLFNYSIDFCHILTLMQLTTTATATTTIAATTRNNQWNKANANILTFAYRILWWQFSLFKFLSHAHDKHVPRVYVCWKMANHQKIKLSLMALKLYRECMKVAIKKTCNHFNVNWIH